MFCRKLTLLQKQDLPISHVFFLLLLEPQTSTPLLVLLIITQTDYV
jgi:hypothetical protein